MRPSRTDRQRVGLRNWHHQVPSRQAQALVTHATQLAMSIVAIGLLGGGVGWHRLCVGFGRGLRHGLVAIMRSRLLGMLTQARRCQHCSWVRTTFGHRHPCARPQPQGHRAKQKAKEESAHFEIINPCRHKRG